jgi:hypothetical protein
MTRAWWVLGAVLGVATAGCKTSNSAGAAPPPFGVTVDGTIDGGILEFLDVGSLSGQGGANGSPLAYAEVYATNKVPACGWLDGMNNQRSNLTTLALLVTDQGGSMAPPPIAPGTYMIGNMYDQDSGISQQATASVLFSDATCQSNGSLTANMGSITFTSITADSIVGTYDLTFYSGDHVTGSFTAPTCTSALPLLPPDAGDAGLDAGLDAGDASTCHP